MRMKMNFLEYYKQILQKVSFDPYLLRKEYLKACRYLKPHEISQLHGWLAHQPFYQSLQPVAGKQRAYPKPKPKLRL